jgi:hypothetical protein
MSNTQADAVMHITVGCDPTRILRSIPCDRRDRGKMPIGSGLKRSNESGDCILTAGPGNQSRALRIDSFAAQLCVLSGLGHDLQTVPANQIDLSSSV